MRAAISTVVLLTGLAFAVPAHAQGAAPAGDARLEMEMKQKRHLVRPPVSTEQVTRDLESALPELDRSAREERLMREVTRPPQRRPDQDFDVRQGIQAEGIQRALRR